MKKFILILTVLLIMLFTMTGCKSNKNYSEYMPKYGPQFILLEHYDDPYLGEVVILADKNTRVMYMYITYADNEGGGRAITVLYDSGGNVRRYMGAISE